MSYLILLANSNFPIEATIGVQWGVMGFEAMIRKHNSLVKWDDF